MGERSFPLLPWCFDKSTKSCYCLKRTRRICLNQRSRCVVFVCNCNDRSFYKYDVTNSVRVYDTRSTTYMYLVSSPWYVTKRPVPYICDIEDAWSLLYDMGP